MIGPRWRAELSEARSYLIDLECPRCGNRVDAWKVQRHCDCGGPFYARYDLKRMKSEIDRDMFGSRTGPLWKYFELLPLARVESVVTLGEGSTPVYRLRGFARDIGLDDLYVKDESMNPTASFKARGMSVAVSAARERGIRAIRLPTAGYAGFAASAFAAAAGISCTVCFPKGTPLQLRTFAAISGARCYVRGETISDSAAFLLRSRVARDVFDVSTMKEPYRLEGKKTMGLEIAEAFSWSMPEYIVYPTGGGTGLLGIWKVLNELEHLGWLEGPLPRMIAVQASRCCPVVHAYEQGATDLAVTRHAHTCAIGLNVPKPFAGKEILAVLRESNGWAVRVSDREICRAQQDVASADGAILCPEAAACAAAVRKHVRERRIPRNAQVLLLNTGSPYLYG
jgi:threonine synthase